MERREPSIADTSPGTRDQVGVIVVDDDPMVCSMLSMILGADPAIEVLATAADGAQAVTAVAARRPAVVLMDVAMPVMDGIEATAAIRGLPEPPEVVILTSVNDADLVPRAVAAGAIGFVLKDSGPQALAMTVRLAAQGLAPMSARSLRQLAAAGPGSARRDEALARLQPLSARELETVVHAGRGRSNAEIGEAMFVSPSTAKANLTSAMAKLGCAGRVELAVLAAHAGLLDD